MTQSAICTVYLSTFEINWFVVYLCACMLVSNSDSSLFHNVAHQHKRGAQKEPNPGLKWRYSIFRVLLIVMVVIIEFEWRSRSFDHESMPRWWVAMSLREGKCRGVQIVSWGILRFAFFDVLLFCLLSLPCSLMSPLQAPHLVTRAPKLRRQTKWSEENSCLPLMLEVLVPS